MQEHELYEKDEEKLLDGQQRLHQDFERNHYQQHFRFVQEAIDYYLKALFVEENVILNDSNEDESSLLDTLAKITFELKV